MSDLPTIVYRCPGPYSRAGGTWGSLGVGTQDELSAALASGWFATLPEAIDGRHKAPSPEPMAPDDESAPTRAEVLQRAHELGIKVDGRWSYARLMNEVSAGGA